MNINILLVIFLICIGCVWESSDKILKVKTDTISIDTTKKYIPVDTSKQTNIEKESPQKSDSIWKIRDLIFEQTDSNVNDTNLIPIDLNDKKYHPDLIIKDTITKDGWQIKYLVKNDAIKHKDLYIEWSKNNIKNILKYDDVLLMKWRYAPMYSFDSKDYIYFFLYLGATCVGHLVLQKNNQAKHLFLQGHFYTGKENELIISRNAEPDMFDEYQIIVYDLPSKKQYQVKFDGLCIGFINQYCSNCLDTVVLKDNHLEMTASLLKKSDKETFFITVKTLSLER